jgi:hypothetical protein
MKTQIRSIVVSGLVVTGLMMLNSCQKENMSDEGSQYASVIDVEEDGSTSVIEANLQSALVETETPASEELALILKMKDEEKLAGDVYAYNYQKWGNNIFSRISNAEDKHLSAIIILLKNLGSADTIISEAGSFENSENQALYTDLISKSDVSFEEALKAGLLIEELDIKDLASALESTTNENVKLVYENLLKGSRNHLRAFNRQLTALGITYSPTYLAQTEFDQIVNAPMEKGKQYKMNGKGNKKGQGKGQAKKQGNCDGSGVGSGQGKMNRSGRS